MLNDGFDGDGDTSLFDADEGDGITSNLSVGDAVVIRIPVTFTPGDNTNFDLDAEVTADSTAGSVSDDSADDVENGEDKPTQIPLRRSACWGLRNQPRCRRRSRRRQSCRSVRRRPAQPP